MMFVFDAETFAEAVTSAGDAAELLADVLAGLRYAACSRQLLWLYEGELLSAGIDQAQIDAVLDLFGRRAISVPDVVSTGAPAWRGIVQQVATASGADVVVTTNRRKYSGLAGVAVETPAQARLRS